MWQLSHYRVSYDYRQVAEEVLHSDAPFAHKSAQRLYQARFQPL